MYDDMKYILVGIITAMGLFMAIAPKMSTKKELRDNENEVAKIRKGGIFLSVAGILALICISIVSSKL